jgi:hypothetical protein
MFGQKSVQTNYSRVHLLKSLTYFAEAKKDSMPRMLAAVEWDGIKEYFVRETPRLLL